MQCSVPGRQCCQCWPRVTAWQWHVCDTSRPEYEASCQVSRVTCHEMLLTLPPHRVWRHCWPCSGHLNSQIKHQSYGRGWLQHCSNEAGACSSAVLGHTFILKHIYESKAYIVSCPCLMLHFDPKNIQFIKWFNDACPVVWFWSRKYAIYRIIQCPIVHAWYGPSTVWAGLLVLLHRK